MHVVQSFEPSEGGLPQHVCDLSVGLVARGHRVVAVGPPDARVRARMIDGGVGYLAVPVTGRLLAPSQDMGYVRALSRVLASERADVLHAHGQKAGILGRLTARWAGVPAVYTPHSFVYRIQHLRRRQTAGVRAALLRELERSLGHRSAAVVAVAEEERAAAHADRITEEDRLHLIRYGVDCDHDPEPSRELLAFKGDRQLFGMVAALRDQKGLPTLLDALRSLRDLEDRVRFAVVGNGPLEDEVRAAVDGELSGFVRWFPFTPPVEPYLATLDVFVLPSYWEALPIAVLEAMCMGLPVIATHVNGTAEAVRDRESGLLVPSHDASALADAVRAMAADPELQRAMGDQGRAQVAKDFAPRRMLDEVEALYGSVVNGGRQGA